jgi:hypothetical protein
VVAGTCPLGDTPLFGQANCRCHGDSVTRRIRVAEGFNVDTVCRNERVKDDCFELSICLGRPLAHQTLLS